MLYVSVLKGKQNDIVSYILNAKIFGRFIFRTIPYGPKILVSENCGDI